MQKIITFILLFFATSLITMNHGMAAVWVKLNENNTSKLSIDKQSILQKEQLKRAWVKIEYKTPQKNIESPEKEYDLSKLLWYFDCSAQKSATSQVFQYLNTQLVYSAGIDVKGAEFIEPVPETDFDQAMRYVCATGKPVIASNTKPAVKSGNPASKPETKTETKAEASAEKTEPPPAKAEPKAEATAATAPKTTKVDATKSSKDAEHKKEDAHAAHWTYEGEEGPKNWGKLKPEFAECSAGRNQSPIDIDATIVASLKPLKVSQKFPAKDIVNNGHTVQASFKDGNMLMIDETAFKLKQVHFHAPSENTIHGKQFPLEAHFVHADAKGNLAVIGVLFKIGKANAGIEKLWKQLPNDPGEPITLKTRVLANEMIPGNLSYYRFSGSLTTPPCSEGVRWLLMRTPMTASKEQIDAFEHAVHHHNNRPVQPLNGRVVVE